LQERHAELIDAAEKDDEFIRRQECRAMRKRRDTQERFSVRMDYLHNQLATLREQFAQLGHLAGITCGFDPERPRSNNILIAAVAEKEAANESQLSYLDELRRSEEDLVVAIAAMEAEESSIQDAFKAAQLADNAKLKQGMYFASRQEQLDMRVAKNEEFLLSLHKALAMMIDRLMASYDPGTVPMPSESARVALDRGENCSMSQAIGGSSAAALDCFQEIGTLPRPASIDEVEFDLMRLDHFLRAVQARAVRLATWFDIHLTALNESSDDTKASAKREMPREVQAFTQLLPTTTSIAEAKAIRTELESHVTRHREDFEMNSDAQMQAALGAQG